MHEKVEEDRVFGRPETFPAVLPPPAPKPVDLFSVDVEGAEVRYAAQGTTARPPLVFVHGWGASHKFWRHVFPAFSPRWRCVAPDLAGFGLSEKPRDRDYAVESFVPWLGKFLDAVGIGRAPLVGHSMGGTIALLFALEHPGRVERLAVVNPLVQGATAFTFRSRLLMLPGLRALGYALAQWRPFRRWVAKDFSYVRRLAEDLADDIVRTTYRSAIRSMLSLARTDLVPRLGGLAVPTLSVGSDRDLIVAPGQHALIPSAHVVTFPETGHMPMLERPAEFNALLDDWLRR